MSKEQMLKHKDAMAESVLYHAKYKGKYITVEKATELIHQQIDMMEKQCDLHYSRGYNTGKAAGVNEGMKITQSRAAKADVMREKRIARQERRATTQLVIKSPVGFRGPSVRSMLREENNSYGNKE